MSASSTPPTPPPRRVASRVIASYPFLELREHDLVEQDAAQRTVVTVHLQNWAIVCAITNDGSFVLVEQHRHGIDGPSLELAGGIVDPGETPMDAARRELREETGYAADRLVELGWVHPNPALHDNRAYFFLAEAVTRVGGAQQDDDERITVRLVNEARLSSLVERGDITHALAILGIARALHHRSSVRENARIMGILDQMEAHQKQRVVALAHRLRPDLTMEDIASPHDFPDLDDPDWHFEDGQLAAIRAVRFALVGLDSNRDSDAKEY